MGGPGSGSWQRWDTRRMIDSVDCLDVRVLSRQGALREGVHAVITWRQGQQAESSISFSCLRHEIVLEYRTRIGSEAWYPVRQEIALEWLPQSLGGRRVWLRCPDCQRRAALVYRSGRRGYVCRLCTGLPYKCESEVLEDRLCRRIRKLRKRVGVANGDEEQSLWHYPKPKYMHQSTYEHICVLAEGVRIQLAQVRNMKLAKVLSRFMPVGEGITWGKG